MNANVCARRRLPSSSFHKSETMLRNTSDRHCAKFIGVGISGLYQTDRISSPNALAATIESKRTVAASTPLTSNRKMDASAAAIAAEAVSTVMSSNFISTPDREPVGMKRAPWPEYDIRTECRRG